MYRLPMLIVLPLLLTLAAACGDGNGQEEPATSTPAATTTSAAPVVSPTAAPSATAAVTPTPVPSDPQRAVLAARAELARWLGPVGDPASITQQSVEARTWSNGCLDLARPGQACTTALVAGYRIELTLANATYEMRTDLTGSVVLWAPSVQVLAKFAEAGPIILRFTTDDGGEIVAQAVAGTSFGVSASALAPGTPVGLGLADAPQSGGQLLVWLDPVP